MGACKSKAQISNAKLPNKKNLEPKTPGTTPNGAQSVFISTDELAKMLKAKGKKASDLVVLNASANPDADVYKEHCQGHIPGARFLDLQLVRDFSKPYPFMMPQRD